MSRPRALAVFEVDHQFVLGGILHRHVGWLLAPEDAIDGRAPELVNRISAVGDKPTLDNEVAEFDHLVGAGERLA